MIVAVNGVERAVDPKDEGAPLLEWLRERLGLTGAKNGCGIGRCGACTVLVDDKPTLACRTKVSEVAGKAVKTIEGMEDADGTLHPIQRAFVEHGAIQCGFCTPGMVLRAHGFLLKNPAPSREAIRKAISPNLCRCTGYQQIIDAIEAASPFYPPERGKRD
ncbi:MAG: (2Fe-2S)-binding protein [Proteobacteria bacterium]|jgi:carbon-monoxide dehydrogenase small subunit|nr:(2Fe-2S)-binding protein [Pseudomonadota bacterium]